MSRDQGKSCFMGNVVLTCGNVAVTAATDIPRVSSHQFQRLG